MKPNTEAVDFPPVINGLDFLQSTVELLTEGETPPPRNLKYAVVHLAAALEALLKARLELENPELTWLKMELFNEAKHRNGDFKSVDAPDALKRINEHCAPETTLIAKLHVTALARMRNRIAHFGLTEKRAAVEVLTTPVLDFLVTFVHDDLLALVPEEQSARAADILEHVRPSLGKIQALVDTRLQPARELKAEGAAHILPCPICAALSVPIMGGENTITCVVCHTDLGTPTDAAWEYAGTSEYAVATDGGEYPVFEHEGFYCGGAATQVPGEAVDGVESTILLCLTCGEECVGVCSQCGRAVTSYGLEEAELCSDCVDNRMARF